MTEKAPEILWHYTSIDTLVKICTNRTIRATHHEFLNDPIEVTFGAMVLKKNLDCLLESQMITKEKYRLIEDCCDLHTQNMQAHHYIFSLSAADPNESLDLWKAYVPKNGGCAIGFNFSKLYNELIKKNDGIRPECIGCSDLSACHYLKPEEAKPILNELKEKIIRLKDICEYDDYTGQSSIKFSQELNELQKYLYILKHSAYSAEQEWRAVFWNGNNVPCVKFEEGKPFVNVCFLEKDFADLITHVYISPHGNTRDMFQYVSFFSSCLKQEYVQNMRKYKLPHNALLGNGFFEVNQCDLPYRG